MIKVGLAFAGIGLAMLACAPISIPTPTDVPTLPPIPTDTPEPVVHAVLFYSPSCPHCHMVMTEVLPPLQKQYGSQLEIAEVDTSTPAGQQAYQSAITQFNIPEERRGVPTLIMDSVVLVGGEEIPQYLPSLIQQGVQQGGVDWPAIPGFVPPSN